MIAQSEVWSQRIAESRWKNDFTFWLIFGLSPNLELSESLSERLIQKVKRYSVIYMLLCMLCCAGITVFPMCSAGWCAVRRMGPKTVSYSHRQLYVCTASTDEDKSDVCSFPCLSVSCTCISFEFPEGHQHRGTDGIAGTGLLWYTAHSPKYQFIILLRVPVLLRVLTVYCSTFKTDHEFHLSNRVLTTLENMEISGNLFILENSGKTQGI